MWLQFILRKYDDLVSTLNGIIDFYFYLLCQLPSKLDPPPGRNACIKASVDSRAFADALCEFFLGLHGQKRETHFPIIPNYGASKEDNY